MAIIQCSVLFVTDGHDTQAAGLRSLGFTVLESNDLPPTDDYASHHAIIVGDRPGLSLPMLAARLRVKPHFGRRILIALVPPSTADRTKREAVWSGFDVILPSTCSARDLAATILTRLRPYPEFRCLLRSPGGRRKAA